MLTNSGAYLGLPTNNQAGSASTFVPSFRVIVAKIYPSEVSSQYPAAPRNESIWASPVTLPKPPKAIKFPWESMRNSPRMSICSPPFSTPGNDPLG